MTSDQWDPFLLETLSLVVGRSVVSFEDCHHLSTTLLQVDDGDGDLLLWSSWSVMPVIDRLSAIHSWSCHGKTARHARKIIPSGGANPVIVFVPRHMDPPFLHFIFGAMYAIEY